MQPPTDGPRAGFSTAQVVGLIQNAPAVRVGAGLELLDAALNVVADLSDDLAGGAVSRSSYATLHGTAALGLSRVLDWGSAIVRPYYLLSDGLIEARFNLGAYYTSVSDHVVEADVVTYDVTGVDILKNLDDPVGDSYAVDTGIGYLAAVATILNARGVVYSIDQAAAATVLPSPMVWPFDSRSTWLTIVNDLLGAVGYAGIWSDWNGRARCERYQPPNQRPAEWTYDTGAYTSMMGQKRTVTRDWHEAPNRWVFYRTNAVDGLAPVEGNGIYTYVNNSTGPTSVQSRGRVITAERGVDAADQAALAARATRDIDSDLRLSTTVELATAPNPLHWHFDRVFVSDVAMGTGMSDCLVTRWTLPLNGGDMTQSWSVL